MKVLATFALLLACSSMSTAQRTPLGELFNVYPKNLAQNEVFQEESWKGLNEEVTKINHWDLWRVELGYGHQYNHEWGNQRVVLLDVGYNNKIGYKFDFEKGHYYVAIDYAPDEHVEPASSKFSIYWGSWLYLMKTYYPW